MPDSSGQRVIIVTGGSRGLGREIALAFGRAGERVVVNFVSNEQNARETVREIVRAGGEAFACRADVATRSDVDALFRETLQRWRRVDVLVNNAGVTRDCLLIRMSDEDWDSVIATNLKGPFCTTRAASAIMTEQRSGNIINIGSIVGLQGREGQANYSASKASLIGLTRAAARELGPFNVKVNAVLPGYLPTAMGKAASSAVLGRVLRENALGRVSDPREVAFFVYQLSLMQNVSGQVFNLDSRMI